MKKYLEISKTCDDFVDHHFQYLSDPIEFVNTLEDQVDWVEGLEGVKRIRSTQYQYNDDFIYPDMIVKDVDTVETMIKATTQKCPICHKICGANNVIICDKCQNAYHGDCFGENIDGTESIMICCKCTNS